MVWIEAPVFCEGHRTSDSLRLSRPRPSSTLQGETTQPAPGWSGDASPVECSRTFSTGCYDMLHNGVEFQGPGPHSFEQHDKDRVTKRLLRRLRDLGLRLMVTVAVSLSPVY